MKPNRFFLLAAALCVAGFLSAQNAPLLRLRSGDVLPTKNISSAVLDSFNTKAVRANNKTFAVIQFESIPDEASRKVLASEGIELLDYLPDNAYTVSIRGNAPLAPLQKARARALITLSPAQKMDSRLTGALPSWASRVGGTVDVWISFPKTFSAEEVMAGLKLANIDVLSSNLSTHRILMLRIAVGRLNDLAALPFIEFVQLAPKGDEPLLYNSRYGSRANVLNASIANGGKNLNGEGVVVGVGDNADVQTHIDFSGRLIDRSPMPLTSGHGHHVTGIVGGAGNGNEMYRGYASKATIVSQGFSGIILNAPTYVNDYGMVITNNSYGDNIECYYHGTYDLYSRLLDQMAIDFPNLQNVFSAGNSGASTCAPFTSGYHTVLGGYQSAKNVLTVGATTDSGAIAGFSSRGPVRDGRTKPELVAMGQFVASTWAGNIYGYNNGTSMSGPAVAGGLALLYQRYRQLNGGANPKNGLMKALICNGSSDRGNLGPDYQYGYGWMNLLRSVDMLEGARYFNSSIANGATANHTITVPANTAQLKVMLYWNDPAASVLSVKTLVNDLDLELSDGTTTYLPKILDTANANLNLPAVSGADHLNNMEQVVITAPAAGNYTIRVKGTAIAQNPSQEYFIVYDPVPVQLKLTAPTGGEGLQPSTNALDMMKISWEAYGLGSGTATLEFSSDNGASWSTIASNVDINRVVYTWWVPNVPTSEARVRITKNGTGETSTSLPFTIVGLPTVSLASVQCEGYMSVNWISVPGATDYEVMMLKEGEMKSVAIATGNTYTFSGLSKDSTYWVAVRARINGKPGRRAPAISRQPSTGTCAGAISDNDLKLDAIIAPRSGRLFTATQLGATAPVTVRIKNLDDAGVGNFTAMYSINGGPFVTENVTATVNAGATYDYTFSATANLSVVGNYTIVTVVKNNTPDAVTANDTAVVLVKQLDNQPLNLTTPFLDNIETAADAVYEKDTTGLNGLDRYDLQRSTAYGRLRTFINTGMAYSGSKALTLDVNRYLPAGNTNYLTGTFNLVNYNTAANELRLDFRFNNHGQAAHPNNKVWIRGNDGQPWIVAYDLSANQDDPGTYKKSASLEISRLLAANSQNFGTSVQVRWGQFGQLAATDKQNAAGYSFDDIRLYEVFNDLQLLRIDSPITASCALTASTPVKITVRNSANTLITNIPVRYRINGGAWVSETVASIAANTTIAYTFSTPANLSALGTYQIEALVDYSGDSFRDNDTASATIVNSPVIASYPYLQNFEGGQGSWYSGGKNSSWEYGTPGSLKINRAASGAKAWKTRLKGQYNDNELSYLYSPCFDLTGMSSPALSFSVALDLEDCGAQLCDGAWVEYSADGTTWTKLGTAGTGTNWYNQAAAQVWSIQDFTRWHVATASLPTGITRLRLRFVMASDPATNREGIAIDDIHIYDLTQPIYEGATMSAPVTQTVSGNNWIDFTSGGQLIASLQPNNQTMGATDVQAYINTGAVRFTATQYYHDRNITIKPANTLLNDSVTVRFYFLDKEVDTLVKATGCPGCTKPASAYELGVSKYSDPDDSFENGSILDNNQGLWTFLTPEQAVKVPFGKGYYAEFKVKDFSEFWLNNGGFTRSAPLPVKLLEFTAQKSAGDVVLKWKTASETNVVSYEVQVARSNADMQAGSFAAIGEVPGGGTTTSPRNYGFTDSEAGKSGPRHYRLKIVNTDGSFSYSPVRTVVFDEAVLWQVYPNPSLDKFNFVYQVSTGELLQAKVLDAKGSVVKTYTRTGNGLTQKLAIDLGGHAAGVYLLQVDAGGRRQVVKLYKQ